MIGVAELTRRPISRGMWAVVRVLPNFCPSFTRYSDQYTTKHRQVVGPRQPYSSTATCQFLHPNCFDRTQSLGRKCFDHIVRKAGTEYGTSDSRNGSIC